MAASRNMLLRALLVAIGIIVVFGPIAGSLTWSALNALATSAAAMVLLLVLAIPLAAVVDARRTVHEVGRMRLALERGHHWTRSHRGEWS